MAYWSHSLNPHATAARLPIKRYGSSMFLGIDTGGTFTDFVYFDDERCFFHKVLSTPDDPSRAIMQGITALGLDAAALHLVHGSTVATNAILEKKGVRTLFVTNRGMEDLLAIGRQTRRELYNLCPDAPPAWPAAPDCAGVPGRVSADGELIEAMDNEALNALAARAAGYEAVAVCTLFSFLNPAQEKRIREALPDDVFVALSHEVLAEYREYERASTTFLNAYVGPMVAGYLQRLEQMLGARHLFIMHSAGGVMSAHEAGEHSVRMVLSGPAGGLVAARAVGEQLGLEKIITFDMGGTSTDVSLLDGAARITTESEIAGMPVAVPMLDIHTIGAGGGSIAWQDTAGLLQVGPESAGADPGPACYGQRGSRPTVTDANLMLGRIPADARLAGSLPLDLAAAQAAVQRLADKFDMPVNEMAAGIIRIAEENMAGALRVVSIQRGHDPRRFALLCFGGAGGLHACSLADHLGITRVILPVASGAFSALGMLTGRRQCDLSRSRRLPLTESGTNTAAEAIFRELEVMARARMPGLALTFERAADLRYCGQGFHLTLPYRADMTAMRESFTQAHEQAYSHTLPQDIEIMTLRLTAWAETPRLAMPELPNAVSEIAPVGHSIVHGAGTVPHYSRPALRPGHVLTGPALVLEDTATLWLPAGWGLAVSPHGHLVLEKGTPA